MYFSCFFAQNEEISLQKITIYRSYISLTDNQQQNFQTIPVTQNQFIHRTLDGHTVSD